MHSTYNSKFRFESLQIPTIKITNTKYFRTVTKPELNLDVALTIPKDCLREKDILNGVYFEKRRVYLNEIANALCHQDKQNLFSDVHFGLFRGDPRKPYLMIYPAMIGETKTKFVIRIFPCLSPDNFKLDKFLPDRNLNRNKRLSESQPNLLYILLLLF